MKYLNFLCALCIDEMRYIVDDGLLTWLLMLTIINIFYSIIKDILAFFGITR